MANKTQNTPPKGKDNNKSNKPNPKKPGYNLYVIIGIVVLFFGLQFIIGNGFGSGGKDISIAKFENYLKDGDFQKVVLVKGSNIAKAYLTNEAKAQPEHKGKTNDNVFPGSSNPDYQFEFGTMENFEKKIDRIIDENNLTTEKDYETENTTFSDILITLLPFIIIIGIWIFIMKRMSGGAGGGPGGQIFNIGKSKAKLFDEKKDVKASFKDVAGLEGAKEEVQEIVDFLKFPEKYTNLGGKIPKGALLVGAPGTGKTLLAKAMAGEANVPFFSLSGSDFVEMFVGVGASRVRDLFKQAKEKSPSIIFIDEIDAIGRSRGKSNFSGSNDERENTLNQLLTEMDGFGDNANVIVLAATNRADVLDKALMRAGRFDRQIYVDLPDIRERKEIFEVHLRPLKKVMKQDFLDAVDRIIGGLEKKNKIMTLDEKKAIAFHEAGHAAVSWLLEHAAPLVKVTIVPRGQSLGAAWYLPEERLIVRTEQMLDEMCAAMGGRAAEKITFDKISTGALSDLEKVTKQAKAMVTIYGLNDKVGNLTYYDSSGQSDYNFTKPYSEKTSEVIDKEISKIIETQYQRALKILKENKSKLKKLADLLFEKEVIFKNDMEKIFGKRPFKKPEMIKPKNSLNGQDRNINADSTDDSEKKTDKNHSKDITSDDKKSEEEDKTTTTSNE